MEIGQTATQGYMPNPEFAQVQKVFSGTTD